MPSYSVKREEEVKRNKARLHRRQIYGITGFILSTALATAASQHFQASAQARITPTVAPPPTPTPEILHAIERSGYPEIILLSNPGDWIQHNVQVISNGIPEQDHAAALDRVDDLVIPALSRYSPKFLKNIASVNPQILLTTNLLEYDQKDQQWKGAAGIVADVDGHTVIIFDLTQSQSSLDHEIFHLVSDQARVPKESDIESIDTILKRITKKGGVSYTPNLSYGEISACTEVDPPGFLNCYGRWNVNEDGATIAEALMNGDPHLYERMETDDVLKQKADAIIAFYDAMSEGEMGKSYFAELATGTKLIWDYSK